MSTNLELEWIDNNNINAKHLGQKGLHLDPKGKGRLALNFSKQLRTFRRSVEHVNESHMSSNTENEMDHNTSGKSENTLSDPIITEENAYDFHGINDLRNQNPFSVIIALININSIRNMSEPLVSFINNNFDILMISEAKNDGTFPDSQFLIESFSVPYRLDRTAKVTFDTSFEGFL